ncbi:AraC family transcriptional regulator [Flammeovirga aprica]|uniref:Helix-turn-helix transcriptional regulator n=1 Tax=Flammeovirga aprica JL-4 TaxID=694437 RepID=A0A7X9RSA4_9BACT|nr:AraC family transcriptional regulator [Flammeovirga aprica]NME66990.1 helix-turn-helix transcriptional regulator [Flammeovirga aprica JL-4]
MEKITIHTGSIAEVAKQLADKLGKEPSKENTLHINNHLVELHYEWFFPFDGIEIGLHNVRYKSDMEVDVLSDKNEKKYIYFQFEYKGNVSPKKPKENQKITDTVTMMSMQSTSIFLNMKAKQGDQSQWVTLRISEDYFNNYMSHMKVHIGKVFDPANPWVIYEISSPKINLLIDDLFTLNDEMTPPLKNSLILARSVEATGLFLDQIIRRENQSQRNNNLHIEDIKRMQMIKEELTALYDNTPSLTSIAEKYGVSVSKLKRDFGSVFGTTIPRFHSNYRLESAYKMLETQKVSVSDVARHFGYKSLSNFSENFKEKFDITPKEVSIKYNL